jgi:rare lipoprotein A
MRLCWVRVFLLAGVLAAGARLNQLNPPAAVLQTEPDFAFGQATWYGGEFHGRPTASGELLDMHALTAAHRELPLGSIVRVTNVANSRSVVVRINDRGPWMGPKRLIDLSYAAFCQLDGIEAGIADVRLEALAPRL